MPTPLLIDTDMGVDDAVAVALANGAEELDLVGLASVGGNVGIDEATANVGRVLAGLAVETWPAVARGLDQTGDGLSDASHVFGRNGLGGVELPVPPGFSPIGYLDLYERLIEAHGKSLVIVAIGPLTNLAAVRRERPGLLERAGQIVAMGGAVWRKGNVTPFAEFNFYRDPRAAAEVLSSGLPITVVPLDVTTQVVMDESHVAHLSRSGTRTGELLARMIRFPLEGEADTGPGTFLVHDAVAVGVLLWPAMFMRSRMGLDITASGEQAGRSKPIMTKDKGRQVAVVISVNVVDFMENLLERLCHERFVV